MNTEKPETQRGAGSDWTVLVVEDDDGLNALIQKRLRRAGFKTAGLSTGKETLDFLSKGGDILLLLDYGLPDMNAHELIEHLSAQESALPPFVIVTGQGNVEVAVEMMKAGANDFIVKDAGLLDLLPGTLERVIRTVDDQRRLATAELKFRSVIENLPVPMAIEDDERQLVLVNRKFTDTFGYTLDDVSTPEQWWSAAFPNPDYRDECRRKWDAAYTKARTNGIEQELEEWIVVCKDRSEKFAEVVMMPLEDGSIIVLRDITTRRQAEEALRKSEQRFRMALQNSNITVHNQDVDLRYTWVYNPHPGMSAESVLGKTDEDLLPPEDAAVLTAMKRRVLESGVGEREIVQFTVNGDPFFYDLAVEPLFDAKGSLAGITGAASNITERKRAEADRERAALFLQAVIDGVPDGLMVVNRDFSIALANKTIREMWGGGPDDALLRCHQICHNEENPCDGKENPCPLQLVVGTSAPVTVEHVHCDAGGHGHPVEIVAAPIFDKSGEVVQVIESHRNISQRKADEEERMNLERRFQHAQKLESLGVLAGGIAHDFNNLLVGVLGNADIALARLPATSPARPQIERMVQAAERAAGLSTQMLAYSGKGKFVVKPIDLSSAIEDVAHLLEVSIAKNVLIRYNLAPDLPAVEADVTQIHQVVMNLITNASEAIGDASGVISVTTGAMICDRGYIGAIYGCDELPEGLYIWIEVSDTGCGMDAETQDKVFDPFFTTKFTGRGLGMAATLGIVRGHHGAIKIYSEPGRGTMIKILLPATDLPADPGSSLEKAVEGWQGSGTVLLVDDEETVRTVTGIMIEELGFGLLTATDGREGVEVFRKNADEIVLVLLDMTMPHMDGEQAFREIRRISPDVRVVLSSGYNEQEATNRFVGKGLAAFIQKPYRLEKLRDTLRGVLGQEVDHAD